MKRFQLSQAAAEDIREIRRYTREQFGLEQAIKIRRRFHEILETLTHSPLSAPLRDEYDPPGKTFRYCPAVGSFVIVYEPVVDGIRVARVLHGARNLARELAREAGEE